MKNNKGFVLVETLIVSVAIAAIFSVIYTNIVPVLGEYEKVEFYDDLDTKYVAHWMRMLIIEKGNLALSNKMNSMGSGYISIKKSDCGTYFVDSNVCNNFFDVFGVSKFYITPYTITGFKSTVKTSFGEHPGFQGYVSSLPDFKTGNTSYYRVIVEVEHNKDLKESEDDYYTSYATVEVNKDVNQVTKVR